MICVRHSEIKANKNYTLSDDGKPLFMLIYYYVFFHSLKYVMRFCSLISSCVSHHAARIDFSILYNLLKHPQTNFPLWKVMEKEQYNACRTRTSHTMLSCVASYFFLRFFILSVVRRASTCSSWNAITALRIAHKGILLGRKFIFKYVLCIVPIHFFICKSASPRSKSMPAITVQPKPIDHQRIVLGLARWYILRPSRNLKYGYPQRRCDSISLIHLSSWNVTRRKENELNCTAEWDARRFLIWFLLIFHLRWRKDPLSRRDKVQCT